MYHRVKYILHILTYLLALHDFRPRFIAPEMNTVQTSNDSTAVSTMCRTFDFHINTTQCFKKKQIGLIVKNKTFFYLNRGYVCELKQNNSKKYFYYFICVISSVLGTCG